MMSKQHTASTATIVFDEAQFMIILRGRLDYIIIFLFVDQKAIPLVDVVTEIAAGSLSSTFWKQRISLRTTSSIEVNVNPVKTNGLTLIYINISFAVVRSDPDHYICFVFRSFVCVCSVYYFYQRYYYYLSFLRSCRNTRRLIMSCGAKWH